MAGVIEGLRVYPDRMARNLDQLGGLVNSQRILLALTQGGMSREDAYRTVQEKAMQVWTEGKDFQSLLKADPTVAAHLPATAIDECFDNSYHSKQVEALFERVFAES